MLNTCSKFIGLQPKTPFLVASGQITSEGSRIKNWVKTLDDNHWGGIVTKTYSKNPPQQFMRPYLWSTSNYKGIAMQNAGPDLTQIKKKELYDLKESCSYAHDLRLVVIVNILGSSLEEWRELTQIVSEVGADAIELNISCPLKIASREESGGSLIGQVPEAAAEVTAAVKAVSKVPIIVKLTPNVSNIVSIANAVKESGADAVSAINTVQGIIGVNIETGVPVPSDIEGRSYISGLSGPLVRPIGLRCVCEIAKNIEIPICGIGGIENWTNVVEYLMLGCSIVQVCTAVMWHGFGIGSKMYEGLIKFMNKKNYSSIDDFQGMALKHITLEVEKMTVKAQVNAEKCNGCGLCLSPCNEAQFGAIRIENKLAIINQDICGGCGLCEVVCRRNAIYFERID